MRKLYSLFFALLCLCGTAVNAQFTVNGAASLLAPNEYQLTPPTQHVAGSVFNNTLLNLNSNFDISTQLYFGADDGGADGLAFVLQSEAPTYLGNYGAGLGYHRFPYDVPGPVNSLIVEFDTYQNDYIAGQDIHDPVEDHLGFMSMSNAYHTSLTALAAPVPFPVNIEDGVYHDARFTWNATTKVLTVTFLGNTYTYSGDIVNTLFGGNSMVYWGFTAGTGSVIPNVHKFKFIENNCGNDRTPPVINCPAPMTVCYNAGCSYTIPQLVATDNCGIASIKYLITGCTLRFGNGNNASGSFNPGTSYITWFVKDLKGNISTCTQTIVIKRVTVTIPGAYAGQGCDAFTIYKGYGNSSITLTANASGGDAPYTYLWSTGATTKTITVSPGNCGLYTYSVRVTDASGCVGNKTIKVKVVDIRCGNNKVLVCHRNFGSGSCYSNEICVSTNAVPAHLAHGDKLGECSDDNRRDFNDDDDDDDHHGNSHDSYAKPLGSTLLAENNVQQVDDIRVQPNPSRGQFEIVLNNVTAGATEIVITSSNGLIVERRSVQAAIKGQSLRFDLGKHAAGIYLVKIFTSDGVETRKVLIQR